MATSKVKKKQASIPNLPRTEWDFSKIPDGELIGCFIWEYLREKNSDFRKYGHFRHLVLLWTYDAWDDRQKLNARYKNIPVHIITSAATEHSEGMLPWQELGAANKMEYSSRTPRRPALISLRLSRQSLWDWTYTFGTEQDTVEYYDWVEATQDLLGLLNDAIPDRPGLNPQDFRRWLTDSRAGYDAVAQIVRGKQDSRRLAVSESGIDAPSEESDGSESGNEDPHSAHAGIPMDLVSAKHHNLLSQPDFLINWEEYDKTTILEAFEEWLEENELARRGARFFNSESRAASLRKDLKSLGIMRLLHHHSLPDLVSIFPTEFEPYKDPSIHKELYALRIRAIKMFSKYVGLDSTELPISASTKSGKSPLGRR